MSDEKRLEEDQLDLDLPFFHEFKKPKEDTKIVPVKHEEDSKKPVPTMTALVPHGSRARAVFAVVRESIETALAICGDNLTPEQVNFLTAYMESGTLSGALRRSNTKMADFRGWMTNKADEKDILGGFKGAFQRAYGAIADALEEEGLKMALNGNEKLLIKFLEAYRPDKFATSNVRNTHLVVGSGENGEIEVNVNSWAELSKKAKENAKTAEYVEVAEIREEEIKEKKEKENGGKW